MIRPAIIILIKLIVNKIYLKTPDNFSFVKIVNITEKNINPIPINETHILTKPSSNILSPPSSHFKCLSIMSPS